MTEQTMAIVMCWAAASCGAFLAFFGLLIIGLLRRMNNLVGLSVIALLAAVGTGVGAVYKANSIDVRIATSATARRSGMDIYSEMFGRTESSCVVVTHHHDRLVPGIDKGICVRASTCASELRRILRLHAYRVLTDASSSVPRPADGLYNSGEFRPEVLGDTVLLHQARIEGAGRSRWIYCRADSSELVAVDVLE